MRYTLALVLTLIAFADAGAQVRVERMAIGGMVGKSAGASLKLYVERDIEAARLTDLTAIIVGFSIPELDRIVGTIHAVVDRPIPDSPLNLFLGPGTRLGSDNSELFFGLSSLLGVFFTRGRFEVFLQVAPHLNVLPEVTGGFGSAVGLRYYL